MFPNGIHKVNATLFLFAQMFFQIKELVKVRALQCGGGVQSILSKQQIRDENSRITKTKPGSGRFSSPEKRYEYLKYARTLSCQTNKNYRSRRITREESRYMLDHFILPHQLRDLPRRAERKKYDGIIYVFAFFDTFCRTKLLSRVSWVFPPSDSIFFSYVVF